MMILQRTLLLALLLGVHTTWAESQPSVTVVELFTSQGCYSCPPADEYLGELAQRDDVIALACHVTYWNYIGWKDTFSSAFCDNRQKHYQPALVDGYRGVYTPQMVVNGRYAGVGSRTRLIDRIIDYDRAQQSPVVPLALQREGNTLLINLPEASLSTARHIFLLGTTGTHLLPISRGENAGKRLPYVNPIEHQQSLGTWKGKAQQRSVNLPADKSIREWVVIVQEDPIGSIIAAGKLRVDG